MSLKSPPSATLIGTMVVVFKKGLLITGEALTGKSELALALLDRGHLFLSDDLIEIKKEKQKIYATAPSLTHPFLLSSSIGIINVEKIFGKRSVLTEHSLDMVLSLKPSLQNLRREDPFQPLKIHKEILEIQIPHIEIPSINSCNLPLLVEILVKNFILSQKGYNASQDFLTKHQHNF
jgi:HPr kinase/phosphorylase